MQHLDDVIAEVGRSFLCPAGDQPGDGPVGDLGDHKAQNDDDKGLKARVGAQVVERTELTQEILQGLHHSPPETADVTRGSLGREPTHPVIALIRNTDRLILPTISASGMDRHHGEPLRS